MENFKQIDPAEITDNFIRAIGREWMLVTAGNRESCNTMTASWGLIGFIWGRPVAQFVIRPQRYTREFVDREERAQRRQSAEAPMNWQRRFPGAAVKAFTAIELSYMIRKAGLTVACTDDGVPAPAEARLILQCRKLYVGRIRPEGFVDRSCDTKWYPQHDYHEVYIAEIERAYVRK